MKDIISKCTTVILLFGLLYLFIQVKKQEEAIKICGNILNRVYQDNPGYFIDVLMESDEYCEYINIK